MKKLNFIKYFAFLPILIFTLGIFSINNTNLAFARLEPGAAINSGTAPGTNPSSNTGQGNTPSTKTDPGVAQSVELENPLKIDSLSDFITAILNIVIILMIPIIVFFIIYAGFRYVMAQGNASQVEEATKSLTYAVIGGVLILGAVAIAEIIKNLVNAFAATP